MLSKFREKVESGSVYLLDKLMVAQNDFKFKKTSHKYKLSFMLDTKIERITAEEIPLNQFDFCDFHTILTSNKNEVFVGKCYIWYQLSI